MCYWNATVGFIVLDGYTEGERVLMYVIAFGIFDNKGVFSAFVLDQIRDQLALDRNSPIPWLT